MPEKSDTGKPLGLFELVDKDLQAGMLESAISRDCLGGTLLFFGPDGSGKSSLAFWLAAALNCLQNGGIRAPCGTCSACHKVATLNHPDLFWIFPLPGSFYKGENVDQTRLAELFEEKRSVPWLDIQFSEKSEHHLAAVRSIREEAAKGCYEGRQKVFVITGADRLRIEASNAFLKLLEEPRPFVKLILLTEKPSSLVPTILSRCQRLHIMRPQKAACLDLFRERFGVPGDQAAEILDTADGNLTVALRMVGQESFQTARLWVEKTFAAVLEAETSSCYGLLDDRNGPMWNRGDFERYLASLSRSLRDVLLFRIAGEDAVGFAGGGAAAEKGLVREFSARVRDPQSLVGLLGRIVNLRDELNRNVNLHLLGWSILHKMREVAGDEC